MMKLYSNIVFRYLLLPMACWLSATFVFAGPLRESVLPSEVKSYGKNRLSSSNETITLLFVGDLMQHQSQINVARKGKDLYDYGDCFRYVAPEIRKADLAIGNLEVTLGGKPYRGYPSFSAPDAYLKAIQRAGFDLMLFANNHCLDRGNRGSIRTLQLMDSLNMIHTGVFRNEEERLHQYPLLIERRGIRMVFLNYTYETNGLRPLDPLFVNYIDKEQIRKDVMKARLIQPDVIIACMHWGNEYELLPREAEREMAKYLLSLGVDHVVGGHPHVAQPLEVVKDRTTPSLHLVAYSLGNFISNMSARHTDGGLVLRMVLKKVGRHTRLVDCGYTYVWTSRPEINHKGQFYVYPMGIDGKLLNDNEKNCMNSYVKGARKVINKYSKGINESFFETFVEKNLQNQK